MSLRRGCCGPRQKTCHDLRVIDTGSCLSPAQLMYQCGTSCVYHVWTRHNMDKGNCHTSHHSFPILQTLWWITHCAHATSAHVDCFVLALGTRRQLHLKQVLDRTTIQRCEKMFSSVATTAGYKSSIRADTVCTLWSDLWIQICEFRFIIAIRSKNEHWTSFNLDGWRCDDGDDAGFLGK